MAINVYWGCAEAEWVRAQEPDPVKKTFYKSFKADPKKNLTALGRCPAFNDYLTNLYALRSIYSFEFSLTESGVTSDLYDQKFFDTHVVVRSIPDKFFTFQQRYIFFTDAPSLLMSSGEFPIYEDNNVTQRCKTLPGTFDIGKWYRNIEFPFFLREDVDVFKIEEKEVYSYLKFHTEEKIKFIQFKVTPELIAFIEDNRGIARYTRRIFSMQDFYDGFKQKDKILKAIKENVLQ